MADEAFALSPINASATLPTDNDYDAICDAFMETSRGRWFLREYTKRNRNADTQMVLEAVARIEDNLARQKLEDIAEPPAAEPPVDIFPAIQAAMLVARGEIEQSFVQDDNKLALDLIKGGMDTIRNVAWALRERGVDLQICGIFDNQVSLMMDGYLRLVAAQASANDLPGQMLAAFDELLQRMADIAAPGGAQSMVADAPAASPVNESEQSGPAATMMAEPLPKTDTVFASSQADGIVDPDLAFREIYGSEHDIEIIESPIEETIDAGTLPDDEDDDFIRAIAETAEELAQLEPAEAFAVPSETDNFSAPSAHATVASVTSEPPPMQVATPVSAPPVQIESAKAETVSAPSGTSLGHALLRNGIIKPDGVRANPMATFNRMSQAEKIAFMT